MIDKDEARARLIALAENTPKGEQRDALIMGANALIDDVKDIWFQEHDKQIIKEFVNEVTKYICKHHGKCEDCDFTYKTCFECFYHTEWLKENK